MLCLKDKFECPIIPTEVYLLDLNFYKEKSESLQVVYLCFILFFVCGERGGGLSLFLIFIVGDHM